MHRNAAASVFDMVNLPAASGDAGRYRTDGTVANLRDSLTYYHVQSI